MEPSAFVLVYTSDTLTAGTPRVAGRGQRRPRATSARAPHVTRILSHALAPRQVSRRRPHRLRHRLPRPAAGRLAGRDPARRRPRSTRCPGCTVRIGGGPAFYGDVQAVTETDLRRSELISLPLAALALLLVFGSVVAAGVPLAVGGAAVLVALAGIFLVASVTPMSIFVLNLATLLGLGLGVDYSLLMTSRFREELAHREGAGPRRRGRPGHRGDRRPGRVLLRPHGAARPAGPRAVRVHDPALGGHRRRDRRRAGGRRRAHAAAGDPRDRRHADRRARRPQGHRGARRRRPVGAPRPARHAPPGRRPVPTLAILLVARRAVPPRPVQRPGRHDPPGRPCRRARRTTSSPASSARASSRRSCSPSARRATPRRPATSPRSTTTPGGWPPTRGSAASTSLVDVDPRLTLAQYQLLYGVAGRPAGPLRRRHASPPRRRAT